MIKDTKEILDFYAQKYNQPSFIELDPISITHQFSRLQDIEISGLFAATLAWGQRKTIIANANKIMSLMDNSPYDFISNHSSKDLLPMKKFVHRTFNSEDLLCFISFLHNWYKKNASLETAFLNQSLEEGLIQFKKLFINDIDHIARTKKHIASPATKSTCKRINMYLRWMVRKDSKGVDFGIWKKIKPAELYCPLDVHVENYARQMGLLSRTQKDWLAVKELTTNLRTYDQKDPIKYDFALFGMGIEKIRL